MHLTARSLALSLVSIFLSTLVYAQPSNDNCSSGVLPLTPQTSCTTTAGTLYLATTGGPANSCGTSYDVWYNFTVPNNTTSISIDLNSTAPTNITSSNTFFQVYSGSNCTLSPVGSCTALGTTLTTTTLTPNTTYTLRIFTTTNPNTGNSNKYDFTVCVAYSTPPPPPANDESCTATTLTIGSASSGTVWGSSASTGIPTGCALGTPDDDVWYKFTATSATTAIVLSSIGTDLVAAGPTMQLFTSTNCSTLVSKTCVGTSTLYVTDLNVGSTYYVRVYSSDAGSIGTAASGSAFTITASVPSALTSTSVESSRMNEVFQQTVISPANGLSDPWEVAYGPDGFLWVTEAKGYKLYRIDPATGVKVTVLDVSQNSKFLPDSVQSFDVQFSGSQNPWPQGGFAGMALHPDFLAASNPKNYVYVSYVHSYVTTVTNPVNGGVYFKNRIVRFYYDTLTGKLGSPVSLCDTLPGSSDHNSQRMIIAPVNGVPYLFYASGDMGAGQYGNTYRENKAQNKLSYEGKILRFNLMEDGDADSLARWIPNDNPFGNSAVWTTGVRNNQGFAYAKINGTDYLYGSSHGPFSDDEINIFVKAKNYGHPIVIGYSQDGNYDNAKAGPAASSLPLIFTEASSVNDSIGVTNYRNPIYSFYNAPKGNSTTTGSVQYIYTQVNGGNGDNSAWPSEAPSGMDIYTKPNIPGWKNSLLQSMLKGGRVMRLKLSSLGDTISLQTDTVTYFRSVNRFRDVALSPDGKSVFAIIDKSSTTSGPTTTNPIVSACAGCVIKYTFLGYNTVNSRSNIPTSIAVSPGTLSTCTAGTSITIDNTNNNLWVPITGPDGNIVAEIKANGNNLGTVTSSFYEHDTSVVVRETSARRLYADRNITITPQVQPSSAVSIRLYITAKELSRLISGTNSLGNPSGVTSIGNVSILKNTDNCGAAMTNSTITITPQYAEAFGSNWVLQGSINSFSSFYFGNPTAIVLPLRLVDFTGKMQGNDALLSWKTENETNFSHFELERSINGTEYNKLGKIKAQGNVGTNNYDYKDVDAGFLPVKTIYYRLKMVDIDGNYSYSKVVAINLERNIEVLLYPNPAKQDLNIRFNNASAEKMYFQITDLAGRVVYSSHSVVGSNATVTIDVKAWKPQVYVLKVMDKEHRPVLMQKFEKM